MRRLKQRAILLASMVASLGWVGTTRADLLLNFPFNEGTGSSTVDTASGLVGVFGIAQDPAVDTVQLVDQSPSGQAGDRSIVTTGGGFLMADDAAGKLLNITNGPITLESWVFIDPSTPAKAAEGMIAYGGSYKMGLRSGLQVFTLYGIVDVENTEAGPVPAGEWVHLAAAWEPGVGVHFWVNGVESFVANETPAARPTQHNYLSLASEGFSNNSVATFDRMRIHHAQLTAEQIDSVAAAPKAVLPTTLASYDFNQAALPATNSVAANLAAGLSAETLPGLTGPQWTNDTPSGETGDFALAFLRQNAPVKEVVTANYGDTPIDLSLNNSSYTLQTWLKLPVEIMEERRVILRSNGGAPRIALSINANRTLHTTVLGTADFTTSVVVPNDNRWHHVAVVMENFERLHFYLDGVRRQTVNRTQTGAPSAGGTPQLLIGKESETRYFRGTLDRVIIHNEALAEEALDFPAKPGVPTFDALAAHPANVLPEAGSTVTFTASPSSDTPATYQWYYRTNLADHTAVELPGETGTTLTIDNVATDDEGYYFLVASNAAGQTESYAANLTLRSTLAFRTTGFEAPEYPAGPIELETGWTTDQNGGLVRVATSEEISQALQARGLTPGETVHGGSQALLIGGAGIATTTIRQVTGLEDDQQVTLDVWVRPLGPGTAASPTGNVFVTMENSSGTRAAAFRLGPNNSIDYGTAITGVWQATGQTWDENTWVRLTMAADYAARTYDFSINGAKVNAEPIPFYTATADRFTQIRIFRGANQAGVILDDLTITGSASEELPSLSIRRDAGQVVIAWPAAAEGFTLQATEQLVPANWTTVPHTTEGAEHRAVITPTGPSRFFRLVK